jgi:hypothetical protein
MKAPVNTHLSPALARSTSSPRRITSSERGIEPVGISEAFSWMRTFCQSVNLDESIWSCHAVRLPHVGFGQRLGCACVRPYLIAACVSLHTSVYLNCCSISLTKPPHTSQTKLPYNSSGRTSLVRVTVPLMLMSCPSLSVRRDRILDTSGR